MALALALTLTLALWLATRGLLLVLALLLSLLLAFGRSFTFFRSAFLTYEAVAAAVVFVGPGKENAQDKNNYNTGDNFVAENSLD